MLCTQVPQLDLLAGHLKKAADHMALVQAGNGQDTASCPPWASDCCNEWQRKIEDLTDKGLNSIEFQQDVQQYFQQSTGYSIRLNTLLKIPLNSLLKFN